MQPNVAKTSKTCFETNSFALQKEIEPKEPKRLQQHKPLEVFKLHFKEFLGTLWYQIKHKTIKKLHTSQNDLKGKIAIFLSNEIHFRGPGHLVQSNSLFEFT